MRNMQQISNQTEFLQNKLNAWQVFGAAVGHWWCNDHSVGRPLILFFMRTMVFGIAGRASLSTAATTPSVRAGCLFFNVEKFL